MKRRPIEIGLLLAVLLLATLPQASAAQGARRLASRNQVALDVGIVSGGLSYARRLGDTPLSVGAGLWGAWEPPNSFDRNVWEPLGVSGFGRYWPLPWLHLDVGATGVRYLWADDCSECTGTFFGLLSSLRAGSRLVSVGPDIAFGRASDDRHGGAWGMIWGAQARIIPTELFR